MIKESTQSAINQLLEYLQTFHPPDDMNTNVLLLCCAQPGALLGGEWSGAGETRQRQHQRFRQGDWLPEPGPGGLASQESI